MNQSMKVIAQIGEVAASGTREVSTAAQEQQIAMGEITSSAVYSSKMAEELQEMVGKFKI
ncbi:hypothetical protein [Bacillus sp. JJ1764]|uniref:hypothetical protein n=1 Tax=Bacillus sp. JJ1764 TaxID=3122964 RepID=UPI002FFE9896